VCGLFLHQRQKCYKLFENTVQYLKQHQAFQGGFCSNALEPHAAYTYCGLAALENLKHLYGEGYGNGIKGIDFDN
jgi:prenyltransferase beta subunit